MRELAIRGLHLLMVLLSVLATFLLIAPIVSHQAAPLDTGADPAAELAQQETRLAAVASLAERVPLLLTSGLTLGLAGGFALGGVLWSRMQQRRLKEGR